MAEVIAVEGHDLYIRYCASCHGISGRPMGQWPPPWSPALLT
jgi:mono/diheme cytochrome c family protein